MVRLDDLAPPPSAVPCATGPFFTLMGPDSFSEAGLHSGARERALTSGLAGVVQGQSVSGPQGAR